MKRIIIIGATSGIGLEVAKLYISQGWLVGIAGRREKELFDLQQQAPTQVQTQILDVTNNNASHQLQELIGKLGGVDVLLLSAGIGSQNPTLDTAIELKTADTNVTGFIRITNTVFHYFREHGGGHIAVISSIAGTKGLGIAPAYSATKRFQNHYIESLCQLANMTKANIFFTDIRPGFVATALLKNRAYPFLMDPATVARQIVKAINNKKKIAVIDWRYQLIVFFWQLIPHSLWISLRIRN